MLGTGTLASKGSTEVSAKFFVLMVQVNSTYLGAKEMIRSIMIQYEIWNQGDYIDVSAGDGSLHLRSSNLRETMYGVF